MADSELQIIAAERLQKEHYDKIGPQYEAHYGDSCSHEYRARFICAPMFAGINLDGLKVLDAMCGSGQLTQYLLSQGATVTGLDISPKEIASFQKNWPHCEAVCASALKSHLDSNSFDCVAVVGGLHHLHPAVNEAVSEFHRILKPGGYFCFAEPHAGSLPDVIRQQWYKHDQLFSDNEAAIDMKALKEEFSGAFRFKRQTYLGNVAYIFVLNSIVFRIPLSLKSVYTPALMLLESIFNKFQGARLGCFVVAQWQKK
jgi:SAM-dependent methyltransferase